MIDSVALSACRDRMSMICVSPLSSATCMCVCVCVCVCVRVCIHTHVCVRVYTHAHTHTHTQYVRVYTYTHTHTHTHTHTQRHSKSKDTASAKRSNLHGSQALAVLERQRGAVLQQQPHDVLRALRHRSVTHPPARPPSCVVRSRVVCVCMCARAEKERESLCVVCVRGGMDELSG